MAKHNNGVHAQLGRIFDTDKGDLTSFFNDVVIYGMDVVASSNREHHITLEAAQMEAIKQGLTAQCPKAYNRFARDFKKADLQSVADFDAYYEYPVLLHYQQDCAIQRDLLRKSFDEEAAILEYLALESVYQVAKAKLG